MFRSQEFDTFRKRLNVIKSHLKTIAIPELTTQDSAALSPAFICLYEIDVNNKTIIVQNTTILNKVIEEATKKPQTTMKISLKHPLNHQKIIEYMCERH